MHKDDKADVGKFILQKLKEKGRSIAWLAREIGCDKSNLAKTLKNSRYIHYKLISCISKALNDDFFAYGSQQLKKE